MVTGVGVPVGTLLVVMVKSWVVNAWIWRWVAAGLISEYVRVSATMRSTAVVG